MFPNAELERQYVIERYKDRLREADHWRLGESFARPTWLDRQRCWLLCRLGGWLIRTGQRLQASGSLSTRLLERV